MCTTDGIEHVVGLVVCGGVQPVFTHGHIDILVMLHTVTDHRWGYTLRRKLHTIVLGFLGNSGKEHLVDKFIDGLSNVTQRLLSTLHGNTRIDGQEGNDVVAPAILELCSKVLAPVLRSTLPRIDVQVLDDVSMGTFHEGSEPVLYLLTDGSS